MYQGLLKIWKFLQILAVRSFNDYFPTVNFFLIHPVVLVLIYAERISAGEYPTLD